MGLFRKSLATSAAKTTLKNPDSVLRRLQSTIILFVILTCLGFILFATWKVVSNVNDNFHERMRTYNVEVGYTGARVGVQYRSRESLVESVERRAHGAVKKAREREYDRRGLLRLKQWRDRKRTVYHGTGAEAANSGW